MPTKTEGRKLTAEERIEQLVAEAPPLSDEVCARIRQWLQPVVTR